MQQTVDKVSTIIILLVLIKIVFFTGYDWLSVEAGPADKAYAVFSLINMIIYFVWAIILVVHRRTVMISQQELEASTAKEFSAYDGSNEIYNPAIGAAHGEDFGADQ